MSFRAIFGAFRVLRRRSAEVGQPGLMVWTDAGERAARLAANTVRDAAHKDETLDREAAREIAAGLAGLADGRVDATDLAHLAKAARLTQQSAEIAHDIGEVVTS